MKVIATISTGTGNIGTGNIGIGNIGIGNIGIGNTSTLATFNKDLGRKCFGLAKMDSSAICGITGATR